MHAQLLTPRLAAPDTVADPQAQERWQCRLPPAQVVQLLPNGSRYQTDWSLHHRSRSSGESTREPFFSYPAGRFLHALGQQLLRSLHRGGTCSASRNRLQGSTSDLIRSSSEASAWEGALRRLPRLLVHGKDSMATALRTPAPLYTVNSHIYSNI